MYAVTYLPKHWYRVRGYDVKKFAIITKPLISNCLIIYSLYNVRSYLPRHWYRGRGYHVKNFQIALPYSKVSILIVVF